MTVASRLVGHLHPEIVALSENPAGETAFWERIAKQRAPLIAPDPDAPGHSIVTFVFPAPEDARHVVVRPGFGEGAEHVMDRVAGTSVCHASYRYRNDARTSYSFASDMPLASWRDAEAAEFKALRDFLLNTKPQPDPHHRQSTTSRAGEGQPDTITSILSLPDAPDQSIIDKRPDTPRGRIERHSFHSEIMGNERRIWIYTPPGYEAGGEAYPVLVAFDGGAALTLAPVHRVLDNLLADGLVAPVIAVFVDNATDTSRNHELPCNEDFARFIEAELLPWLRDAYRVSHDPKDHFVTGVSYGGLAAMWLGFRLPHVFGNVISQAASLWWGPGFDIALPFGRQSYASHWLVDQYEASPRLPVRFWMEIGLMEPLDLMIEPNRRMKAVLQAKGYDLTYSEPCGGHDYALWRGTLARALETMLPPKT